MNFINHSCLAYNFKVLALSETWGRADLTSTVREVPGYNSWSTERTGLAKGGGGLTIYYRNTLRVHKHIPSVQSTLEYVGTERQWLLITGGSAKCAFLHTYLACQTSRNTNYLQWNDDLYTLLKQEARALRQQGFMILAMGDFNARCGRIEGLENNTPDLNENSEMFFNFLNETNLLIINSMPIARGTFSRLKFGSGHPASGSLLDYGLIDQEYSDSVTSFVIDSDARFQAGSDHALLECTLTFTNCPRVSWQFTDALQYNISSKTKFDKYQLVLDSLTTSMSVTSFESLSTDQMLGHISEQLNSAAEKSFGFKIKRKQRNRKLPQHVLDDLKRKNELMREIEHLAINEQLGFQGSVFLQYIKRKKVLLTLQIEILIGF